MDPKNEYLQVSACMKFDLSIFSLQPETMFSYKLDEVRTMVDGLI
jgi:hypothetical protein